MKKWSEEVKKKISESMKGNQNRKGKPFSDQALQDRSSINKGKIVYNNGERNIFLMIGQEIPEGFVEGVLITEEDRQGRRERMNKINDEKWSKWRNEHEQCSIAEQSD